MASTLMRPVRTAAFALNASRLATGSFRLFSAPPARRDDSAVHTSQLAQQYLAKQDLAQESREDLIAAAEQTGRQTEMDRAQRQAESYTFGTRQITREAHLANLAPFTSPHHYSLKFATRGPKRGRRAKLGPDPQTARRTDVFAQLGLDPVREATNRELMSNFVSDMGKIRGRAETELTRKSQRRLGKAIRRAKMMGLTPVLSRDLPRNLLTAPGARVSQTQGRGSRPLYG